MKRNLFPFEDDWIFAAAGAGDAAVVPALNQPHDDDGPSNDTFWTDDGDPFPFAAQTVTTITTSAAKPLASIATLADYLINGFWHYNSSIAHHWASNTITYDINGLNSSEQLLALTAMQAWHEVANVNFVQTSGSANITFTHNGTMQAYASGSWNGSGSITSMTVNISTDWVTTDGGANDGKTGIDSYAYQTYLHEIGHALGLGHQGPYNGSASYSTNALYANDTWQYSTMSYFAQSNYGSSYRYVVTPQMADIYAVVAIYGAAISTRTGDTVYGFNSNAGAVYNFGNYSAAPALTIYDSGGNDTLDCSNYSAAQTIDLHAGAFSSVGGLSNNIGIALGATIESAIGGSGNDRLTASDASCRLSGRGGNDTLVGGAGNDRLIGGIGIDTLSGGGAADTFVFAFGDSSAASGQHDRITDFTTGVDHIDLSGIDAISITGGYDVFRFIATAGFSGSAGELDYFYNSSLGVTTLQGDTNGDTIADFAIDLTGNLTISLADLIGAYSVPVVIESIGATALTRVGSNYYLYANGTSTGPTLKYGGTDFYTGQVGDWTPIGVEKTASGYQVAWKVAGADQYTIWNADNSGNYVSSLVGVVSGSNLAFEAFETSFQQDLNGDGRVGPPAATMVEGAGSIKLDQIGSGFYLDSVSSAAGTGPTLKWAGGDFYAGELGGWTPIGVEKTATGYAVAWKIAGADQYTIWNADNSGNYVSSLVGVVSGSNAVFKSFEATFLQDLNGDGVINAPLAIESFGLTKLDQAGNEFYLDPVGGGTGPTLKYGGTDFYTGQVGDWTPIGVEKTASGYQVAWKVAGADQYTIWNADNSGNYVSSLVGVVSGSNLAFEAFETSFQQDLNGDGRVGPPAATMVEGAGSIKLDQIGSGFYLDSVSSAAGTGPTLKWAGGDFYAGELGGWTPIGVEKTATGYAVAWKIAGADQYTIWNADNSGNYVSSLVGVVSGSNAVFKSFEATFLQDLNGDGVNSAPLAIESFGITKLVRVENKFYLDPVGGGIGPTLKWSGADFYEGELGGWTPIGVEKTASGYQVAWKVAGADQYTIWNADNNGNYVSSLVGVVSGSNLAFETFETSFQQDLNGDGSVGVPPAAAFIATSMAMSDTFLFRADFVGTNAAARVEQFFAEPLASPWTGVHAQQSPPGVQPGSPMAHQDLHSTAATSDFQWIDLHGAHFIL